MKTSKILKIGDSIFKRLEFKGTAEYKIIGVRKYSDNVQYETECLACYHGDKCKVLVEHDENGIRYISTLNDDSNEHYFWHDDGPYYKTMEETHIRYLQKIIENRKKTLTDLNKKVEETKKEIIELETNLKAIEQK